jgi:hypothetical protein
MFSSVKKKYVSLWIINATLDSLPNEIIEYIFLYIIGNSTMKECSSIARKSKRMLRIADDIAHRQLVGRLGNGNDGFQVLRKLVEGDQLKDAHLFGETPITWVSVEKLLWFDYFFFDKFYPRSKRRITMGDVKKFEMRMPLFSSKYRASLCMDYGYASSVTFRIVVRDVAGPWQKLPRAHSADRIWGKTLYHLGNVEVRSTTEMVKVEFRDERPINTRRLVQDIYHYVLFERGGATRIKGSLEVDELKRTFYDDVYFSSSERQICRNRGRRRNTSCL